MRRAEGLEVRLAKPKGQESDGVVAACMRESFALSVRHIWYRLGMVKTTLYLDEATDRALKQLSRSQQRSQAEVIREALSTYAARQAAPAPKGIGAYHSGRSDVAEQAEELLRRAARAGR
jgi:predicted transcriptional regulator